MILESTERNKLAGGFRHGMLDFLTGGSAEADALRRELLFLVVPMLNPDGVIIGNYRCSLAAVDLNRRCAWRPRARVVEAAAPYAPEAASLRPCIVATPCTQVGAAFGAAAPDDLRLQAAPGGDSRAAAGCDVRRPPRPLAQAERLHVRLRARARRWAAREGPPTCHAPCTPTHPRPPPSAFSPQPYAPLCNPTRLACSPTHPGLPAPPLARRAHL